MKLLRKFIFAVSFIFCFVWSLNYQGIDAHAQVKLNKKEVSICRYHSVKLKVTGTKKKIKWKSSNKKIATVSQKGIVTGVSEGTTTITAKIKNSTYKCKVTVYDYDEHTQLAAYGEKALNEIMKKKNKLEIKKVWQGSLQSNVPFACFVCKFVDNAGKKQNACVYVYESEMKSTSYHNIKTNYYEAPLTLKFVNGEMDDVLKQRSSKLKMSKIKECQKILFQTESIKVSKGKNFFRQKALRYRKEKTLRCFTVG